MKIPSKGVIWKMNKPYDFVPFLKCEPYKSRGKLHEGTIPITIRTLTPIHIYSGSHSIDENKNIFKSFIRVNDRLIIPGTSLKGVVRSIAEAISYSCYTAPKKGIDKQKLPSGIYHDRTERCITCNMFGSMGYKSKIQFNDCYPVEEVVQTEIVGLPASYKPRPNSALYFDDRGKYKGRKFYRHGILGIQQKGDILYECVPENTEFQGEIKFKELTDEQVQLLCFSIGLSGDIQPKIGFGKGHFYGSISIESSEEKWADKAREYKNNQKDDISKNIARIIEILNFKNAVKSLG